VTVPRHLGDDHADDIGAEAATRQVGVQATPLPQPCVALRGGPSRGVAGATRTTAPRPGGGSGEVQLGDVLRLEGFLDHPSGALRADAARAQLGDEAAPPARLAPDPLTDEGRSEGVVVEPATLLEVRQACVDDVGREVLAEQAAPQLVDATRAVGEVLQRGLARAPGEVAALECGERRLLHVIADAQAGGGHDLDGRGEAGHAVDLDGNASGPAGLRREGGDPDEGLLVRGPALIAQGPGPVVQPDSAKVPVVPPDLAEMPAARERDRVGIEPTRAGLPRPR